MLRWKKRPMRELAVMTVFAQSIDPSAIVLLSQTLEVAEWIETGLIP
jgi:hypothetical protein